MTAKTTIADLVAPGRPSGVGIRLSEVFASGKRLEANAYGIAAREAVSLMVARGLSLRPVFGTPDALCHEAHNAFRFRRIYVDARHGVPFLSSADIINMRPEADAFLSRKLTKNLDRLLVRHFDVLISCSGTVGNVALAGASVSHFALSQDAIRARTSSPEQAGYLTAFLRSRFGRTQLTGSAYGSVIVHIEPEHLSRVLVPALGDSLEQHIGALMCNASSLRDLANVKLATADDQLRRSLRLPRLDDLSTRAHLGSSISSRHLQGRLEGSYHSETARAAYRYVTSELDVPTLPLGSPEIASEIRAVTKFRKRVYVNRGGIPLLSSRQLFQVDPVGVKQLAKKIHAKDMAEISLEEGMIAITSSGTIGKVQIVPSYMHGWAANQHSIRVTASALERGYLFAWLNSEFGRRLITRHAYGSVILEIDRQMLSSVPVPLPGVDVQQRIGALVDEANRLRDEAWTSEQTAIHRIEDAILTD